jgi:hypothetical protein
VTARVFHPLQTEWGPDYIAAVSRDNLAHDELERAEDRLVIEEAALLAEMTRHDGHIDPEVIAGATAKRDRVLALRDAALAERDAAIIESAAQYDARGAFMDSAIASKRGT